jgi:hypothetical protein
MHFVSASSPPNRVMIDRLAHRLDEVGELTGEQIDAILLEVNARRGRQPRSLSGPSRAMT